jgi:hypothetical protein
MSKFGDVEVLDPWDVRNVTETYDLAVGVGPVTSCPQARWKILFVLGDTARHKEFGWDTLIVTSRAALVNVFMHNSKTYVHPMPLLEMEAGSRRLMKQDRSTIRLGGPIGKMDCQMSLWGLPEPGQVPFSAMDFNSRCLNGAVGDYSGMDNGYDIQVRRHLALGSVVCCPKDRGVIGDLADVVIDESDLLEGKHLEMKQEVIEDKVSKSDYVAAIEELIRRS